MFDDQTLEKIFSDEKSQKESLFMTRTARTNTIPPTIMIQST